MNQNTPYLLALNQISCISIKTSHRLRKHWPNLKELFESTAKEIQQVGFSPIIAEAITTFPIDSITSELSFADHSQQYLITIDDDNYPALLKEIYDPPLILYAKGNLACLDVSTLAIVGSRKPSINGFENAWQFAFNLAEWFTLVSGLAIGVDGQAHRGCLANKGSTIAVLGSGLEAIYPPQHLKLADKITEDGLLLSEFSLKSPPIARHFPQRNRIISGLSLALLVVEATIKSGSLITARLALEQNRSVLAIPGSILNPQAKGCHYLLQQGAKLITDINDILEELGIDNQSFKQSKAGSTLSKFQFEHSNPNVLLPFIGYELTTLDQMLERSNLAYRVIIRELTSLELDGVITAIPGGYIRCA